MAAVSGGCSGSAGFRRLCLSIVRGSLLGRKTAPSARGIHCSSKGTSVLRAKSEPGGPVYEGPEYIPTRKAKNPMKTVGLAWALGFPSGILLFFLAKREVDKNRLKQLKVRQRMRESNEGEYKRVRYRKIAPDPGGEASAPAKS